MDRVTEFLETEFPDAEERALLLGVASALADKTAKLVYADWLDDRTDPRAEYVRLLVKNEGKKPTVRMKQLRKKCSGSWLSMMGELHDAFQQLKASVAGCDRGHHLDAAFVRGLWDVRYSGGLDEGWEADSIQGFKANVALSPVLCVLGQVQIASVLRVITLDDEGGESTRTNGTLHIALFPPPDPRVLFPYLEAFTIQQGLGIILSDPQHPLEEMGQVAKLLHGCPRLRKLVVPSAPNAEFFAGPTHPLEELDVHSGYDTQQFISNLARTDRFPNLRVLRYTDYCCETKDLLEYPNFSTPFEHFAELLRSPAMSQVEEIELREVLLTPSEVRSLRRVRSKGVRISRSEYAWD